MSRPTIDVDAAPGGWPPPWPNVAELAGSDRKRLLRLSAALPQRHPAWRTLSPGARSDAETSLRVLTA
jgi:hypothetical protein